MSSFDEGGPGVDLDQIKAQIRVFCEARRWSFEQLCRAAGVDAYEVSRAIELGTRGFPETLQIFNRLCAAFGVNAQAFLEGTAKPENAPNQLWLATKKLLWKFVYKMNVSHVEGGQFERFLRELLGARQAEESVRFRKGAPKNLKDMALYYERFRSQKKN